MNREQLKALIPFLPTEQLAELLNSTDCGLDRAGIPPYIQENNEEAHECILEHLAGDATCLLKAVATNEDLFKYISIDSIAECFEQNGIELTIKPIHHDN